MKRRLTITGRARVPGVLLLALCGAALAGPALAQLRDCPGMTEVSGLKVLVDEVAVATPGAPPPLSLERLAFLMDRKLRELRVELGDPLEVVICEGRRPRTVSDFNRQQVDLLNTSNVVLELWGVLEPVDAASHRALLGYTVPPLRFYEHFGNTVATIPGAYQSEYLFQRAQPETLLSQSEDLKAYVALGTGIKALKNRQLARAQKSLCRARHLLQPGAAAPTDPDQAALVAYALREVRALVQAARADTRRAPETLPFRRLTPEQAALAARCGV